MSVLRGRLVPCWWARLVVESTDTFQSIAPAASARISSTAWIPVPNPVCCEAAVALRRSARAELLRQVPPCDPAPVPAPNTLDDLAVVPERAPALAVGAGHQRVNAGP